MTGSDSVVFILLAVAIAAANAPFISERVFFFRAAGSGRKSLGWRLLELVLLYLLVGAFSHLLEIRLHGAAYPQGWAFYAVTFCLFLVFASPGFVVRYLWKRTDHAS